MSVKSQQQVELGLHGGSDVGTKQKGKLDLRRDHSLPSTFLLWWLPVCSMYITVISLWVDGSRKEFRDGRE